MEQLQLYSVKLAKPKGKYKNKDLPVFGDCRSHRRDPAEGEGDFSRLVARHWANPPAPDEDEERADAEVTYRFHQELTLPKGLQRITLGALFIRGETGVFSDLEFADGNSLPRGSEDREDFTLGAVCSFPADSRQGFLGVHWANGKTAYRAAKGGISRAANEIGLRAEVKAVTAPEKILRAVREDRITAFELLDAKRSSSVRGFGPNKAVAVNRSHKYVAENGFLRVPARVKNYFLGEADLDDGDVLRLDDHEIGGAVVRVKLEDGTPRSFTVGSIEKGRPIGAILDEYSEKAANTARYVRVLEHALGRIATPLN